MVSRYKTGVEEQNTALLSVENGTKGTSIKQQSYSYVYKGKNLHNIHSCKNVNNFQLAQNETYEQRSTSNYIRPRK